MNRYDTQVAQIGEIINYIWQQDSRVPKKTINWLLYNMVQIGEVVRIGRGVYSFSKKESWKPILSQNAKDLIEKLKEQLPYLQAVITDTSELNEFMVLQPFLCPVILEVPVGVLETMVLKLRELFVNAFEKKDYRMAETFSKNESPVFVTKTIQTTALLTLQKNIKTAKLEKILVDALCDTELYGQNQGWELENIYQNTSEKYALNYSQLLKYATNRGKKEEVSKLLERSKAFRKYQECKMISAQTYTLEWIEHVNQEQQWGRTSVQLKNFEKAVMPLHLLEQLQLSNLRFVFNEALHCPCF